MRRSVWLIGIAMCLWPLLSGAQTRDEFLVRHTQDYVRLCTASSDDPMYAAAMGFCHGYAVGAYHYYLAEAAGPQGKPFLCPPEPPPSRTEILTMFIAWAQQHLAAAQCPNQIIVITAHGTAETRVLALRAGAAASLENHSAMGS